MSVCVAFLHDHTITCCIFATKIASVKKKSKNVGPEMWTVEGVVNPADEDAGDVDLGIRSILGSNFFPKTFRRCTGPSSLWE